MAKKLTSLAAIARRLQTPYLGQAAKLYYGGSKQAAKAFGVSAKTFGKIAKGNATVNDHTLKAVQRGLTKLARNAPNGKLFRALELRAPTLSPFELKKILPLARRSAVRVRAHRRVLREMVKIRKVKSGSDVLARLNVLADSLGLQRITVSPPKKKKRESVIVIREALTNAQKRRRIERNLKRAKRAATRARWQKQLELLEADEAEVFDSLSDENRVDDVDE